MVEQLGIALELINRRNALAARLTPAARARVYPHLFGPSAPNPNKVYPPRPAVIRGWSQGNGTPGRPSPRAQALAVEPQAALVVETCARLWDVESSRIYSAARARAFMKPRRAAIVLLRELLALSLPTIGHILNRDHTTVMHALQRQAETMETDADYAARFTAAESALKAAFAK